MHRLSMSIVFALVAQASSLDAQFLIQVDTAQIDSLGASLNAEWRRFGLLSFQAPISEVTRARIVFQHNSAREGMAINDRLRFIATLRLESPGNPSLTEKLLREATGLKRQSATLRDIVHGEGPGSTLDQLLGALADQALALEASLGARASAGI